MNGDGFISVRDRDTGAVGATVWKVIDGVATQVTGTSRGALTDDMDLIKNIEQLQFADELLTISGANNVATGTVTIADPTPFEGKVTPYVGQQLSVTSVLYDRDNDLNGDGVINVVDGDVAITGVTYEWQTTEFGHDSGWSTITTDANPYTVRSVDPGHVLRAVATFTDALGNTERVISAGTDNPTAAYSVRENSPTYNGTLSNAQNIANGSVVATRIPFSIDYDSESINGAPPADIDLDYISSRDRSGQQLQAVASPLSQSPVNSTSRAHHFIKSLLPMVGQPH